MSQCHIGYTVGNRKKATFYYEIYLNAFEIIFLNTFWCFNLKIKNPSYFLHLIDIEFLFATVQGVVKGQRFMYVAMRSVLINNWNFYFIIFANTGCSCITHLFGFHTSISLYIHVLHHALLLLSILSASVCWLIRRKSQGSNPGQTSK